MENFKEKIKLNSDTMERLNIVSHHYQKNGRKLELRDKIATAVYMSILDIETKNEEEEKEKLEFLNSLNQIIYNYEDLKPIISEYLRKKRASSMLEK